MPWFARPQQRQGDAAGALRKPDGGPPRYFLSALATASTISSSEGKLQKRRLATTSPSTLEVGAMSSSSFRAAAARAALGR